MFWLPKMFRSAVNNAKPSGRKFGVNSCNLLSADTSSEEPPKSTELEEQSRSKGDSETHGSKPERSADISQITDEDKKSALNQQPAETCPDCASKASYLVEQFSSSGKINFPNSIGHIRIQHRSSAWGVG